ncbi:MAG: alpha/beta hydrolase [Cyanobacteria bacterium J06592_8]
MLPSFLPTQVQDLTESTSINLVQQIEREAISTPLRTEPILTSYIHQGSKGIPILLLHGFDSSVIEFRRLFPQLMGENETWAVDLLGFGFTERDVNVKINPDAIATHLHCFWQSLIQQPVILVGTSMGGAAAIDFTLRYPEAVHSLVLIGSAGMSPGPILGKFIFPPFDTLAAEFLRNPKIRQGISETAYYDKSYASRDAQICAALHLEMPLWNRALISFTKSGGYGSFAKSLNQIKQKTLILWGENDRILGTKDAQKFQNIMVNAELIWIKNCGHVPHLEQSEITAQQILNFRT